MAERKKKPAVDNATDLSTRLQAAEDSIDRVRAVADVRKSEQEKNLKKAKSDSRARARGSEKQRKEDERRADLETQQRLAELEYAEDYRKKLQRERRKAEAEKREARIAAEEAARAARSAEIAELLEKERREARERSERREALLNRVARAKEKLSEPVIQNEEAVPYSYEADSFDIKVVESPAPEAIAEADEQEETATPAVFAEAELATEEAEPMAEAPIEESLSDSERFVVDITDDRMILNIDSDGSVYQIIEPEAEAAETEQTEQSEPEEAPEEKKTERVVGDLPDVKLSQNPVVAAIQQLGKRVYTTSTYRKYTDKSRNAIKEFNRIVSVKEEPIPDADDCARAEASIEALSALAAIVEIRCDNLRVASRFGQKSAPKIKEKLLSDIERYNNKTSEFTIYTGEQLTRISLELPERIAKGSGVEIIPVMSHKERYIEFSGEYGSEGTRVRIMSLGDFENRSSKITPDPEKKIIKKGTFTLTPVAASVTAAELLEGIYVTSIESYDDYRKIARYVEKSIEREIKKVNSKLPFTTAEGNLSKRLEKQRKAIEKLTDDIRDKMEVAKDRLFTTTLAVLEGKKAEFKNSEEAKSNVSREAEESETKKKQLVLTLALRREKLIVAINMLAGALVTENSEKIEKAKSELHAEMISYNNAVALCAAASGINITPVLSTIVDKIVAGERYFDIPRLATLSELVESVGDVERVVCSFEEAQKTDKKIATVIKTKKTDASPKEKRGGLQMSQARFFIRDSAAESLFDSFTSGVGFSEGAVIGTVAPAASALAGGALAATAIAETATQDIPVAAIEAPMAEDTAVESIGESSLGEEFSFEPGVFAFEEDVASDIPEAPFESDISEILAEESTEGALLEQLGATQDDTAELLGDTAVPLPEALAEVTEELPFAEGVEEASLLEELVEEAPIEEIAPRMLLKTTLGEGGEEIVEELPFVEELIDDETTPASFIGADSEQGYEPLSADDTLMPIDMSRLDDDLYSTDGEADIRIEDSEMTEGAELEDGELPLSQGPIYPGNMVGNSGVFADDYEDPDDIATMPPVVEIEDNAENIDNDVLTNPTKRGLKKHLSYLFKKIKKAEHERAKLGRKKRQEKSVVPKAKHIISILGVQKEIIDIYCNALTSCVEVGSKGQSRRIATALRAELKRYNRFVKEYERLTDDRLTKASLDIPAAILEGEDYQVLPKVKLREFEAPENGIVFDDGITEIADYDTGYLNDVVMTEKDLKNRLQSTERDIEKLHADLDKKIREKRHAWGIDKTIIIAECFAIQKKLIDTYASNLHAACQVSSIKNIQQIKRDLAYEIKQYNRLVSEYKAVSGNKLTPASVNIPQDIIQGNVYTPVARVGCVHTGDDELGQEIASMSRNSYGVEDGDLGEAGRAAFRSKVVSQANKDLSLVTKRADYEISMLESERDILDYRFGKEPAQVRREKRDIARRIEKIRAKHKAALKYENNDNRRYYAAVTANPKTMNLRNKRADRTRIAALRSRIISLLNERDIVNGKLMALYAGTGEMINGSVNQTWRRVKNNAAAKSKKKQKELSKVVKALPITLNDKNRFYTLMNKKIDAESTIALTKYRMRKEKMHKDDKLLAKRDIKEMKNRAKVLEKDVRALLKSTRGRIAEIEAGTAWIIAFFVTMVIIVAGVAIYFHYFGDGIMQILSAFS